MICSITMATNGADMGVDLNMLSYVAHSMSSVRRIHTV